MIAMNTQHTGDPRRDNRGYAESMTSEQVDSLLSEDWLRQMVADIRNGNEALKDKLPYVCPHYSRFKDNHRAQKNIIPEAFTFMTCVDVDDKELVEQAIRRALEVNEDEYSDWQDQVLRIEYSARKKVHIYIRIPKGMTIEEAQTAFCTEIDIPQANDGSCVTPERFIYLTGKDEEVFRSQHWLEPLSEEEIAERREAYLQRGLDVDGRKMVSKDNNYSKESRNKGKIDTGVDKENPKILNSLENKSPSLDPKNLAAFDLCAEQAGLNPGAMDVWGEHNWHANLMAVLSIGVGKLMSRQQLQAVVAERLPNYSQTEDCQKLIDYFYENYNADKGFMNASLREINAKAQQKSEDRSQVEDVEAEEEQQSTLSTQLSTRKMPQGIRD